MSEKKVDKAKAAKKLHQLQKKLNRTNENESWLSRKIKEIREHKLIQILKSTRENRKFGQTNAL